MTKAGSAPPASMYSGQSTLHHFMKNQSRMITGIGTPSNHSAIERMSKPPIEQLCGGNAAVAAKVPHLCTRAASRDLLRDLFI